MLHAGAAEILYDVLMDMWQPSGHRLHSSMLIVGPPGKGSYTVQPEMGLLAAPHVVWAVKAEYAMTGGQILPDCHKFCW